MSDFVTDDKCGSRPPMTDSPKPTERCRCNEDWPNACGPNCVCLPHSLRSASIMGRDTCKVCGATVPVESRHD